MSKSKISNQLISQVHDYWINTSSREMWIHGVDISSPDYEGVEPGVEYLMANKIIKNLHLFLEESKTKPVVINMHSCGGVWEDGMAIYDTIKLMPYPVTIISYTHARSMSSIILQAADKRILLPNSYFLIHFGTLGVDGNYANVISEVEYAKKCNEKMLDIYVESAKKSKKFLNMKDKKIRKIIKDKMNSEGDVFFTPTEAIEWGFADDILKSWDEIK